jgi:hypothetical protein
MSTFYHGVHNFLTQMSHYKTFITNGVQHKKSKFKITSLTHIFYVQNRILSKTKCMNGLITEHQIQSLQNCMKVIQQVLASPSNLYL